VLFSFFTVDEIFIDPLRDPAVHFDNIAPRPVRLIIVEPGQDPVSNLLNDEFFVAFAFFTPPKHPVAVAFHILDIILGADVLILGKCDGKTGFDFLCAHSLRFYNCYAIEIWVKILKTNDLRQFIDRLRAFLCAAGTVSDFVINLGSGRLGRYK
jgi:hypothetical protein